MVHTLVYRPQQENAYSRPEVGSYRYEVITLIVLYIKSNFLHHLVKPKWTWQVAIINHCRILQTISIECPPSTLPTVASSLIPPPNSNRLLTWAPEHLPITAHLLSIQVPWINPWSRRTVSWVMLWFHPTIVSWTISEPFNPEQSTVATVAI